MHSVNCTSKHLSRTELQGQRQGRRQIITDIRIGRTGTASSVVVRVEELYTSSIYDIASRRHMLPLQASWVAGGGTVARRVPTHRPRHHRHQLPAGARVVDPLPHPPHTWSTWCYCARLVVGEWRAHRLGSFLADRFQARSRGPPPNRIINRTTRTQTHIHTLETCGQQRQSCARSGKISGPP